MAFTHEQDAAIAFAKFMFAQHGKLHPWSTQNASEYDVDKAAFGGSPHAAVPTIFYRMTPEEYEKQTGKNLNDDYWNWDSWVDNWYTGTIGSWVGGNVFGLVSSEAKHKKQWWDYRKASGTWNDAGEVSAPSASASEAPWAQKLTDDWAKAVRNRTGEVDDVRTEIEYLMPTLVKASSDYMHMDLGSATGLKLSAEGMNEAENPPVVA